MKVIKTLHDRLKVIILKSFGRVRQLIIGRHCIAVLSRTNNGLLLAPTSDLMVGRRLCFDGCYDRELLSFILAKCDAGSRVLFVGAHVGALAVPVARKARTVVAVEANPATLELLRINVMLNKLDNIETHGFAAGAENGEANFLTSHLNSGGSGLELGDWNHWAYVYDEPEKIRVQVKRLDDAFPNEVFNTIVMDVEGAEPAVLRGMANLLARCRTLIVEVFEGHLRQVAKVSNEEFLSLVGDRFDEALILPEKPRRGQAASIGPYARGDFPAMMIECCKLRTTNVMFSKLHG